MLVGIKEGGDERRRRKKEGKVTNIEERKVDSERRDKRKE